MTIPRCLCCDQPHTAVVWLDGFCVGCVGSVLRELLAMGDLKPSEVTIMADMFRQVGARTMAGVITKVPFDGAAFDTQGIADH